MGTRTALLRTDRNYCHRMSVAHLYPQAPHGPRATIGHRAARPEFVSERFTRSSGGHEARMSLSNATGPFFWSTPPPRLQMVSLKGNLPPPRFAGPRVRHRENEGIHRANSGNPARRNGVTTASRSRPMTVRQPLCPAACSQVGMIGQHFLHSEACFVLTTEVPERC
jgi:hypothetical protein